MHTKAMIVHGIYTGKIIKDTNIMLLSSCDSYSSYHVESGQQLVLGIYTLLQLCWLRVKDGARQQN